MQDVIILVGKNGAGKGSRLSEFLEGREDRFMKVSGSDVLREEIAKGQFLYAFSKRLPWWLRR